MSCARRWFKQGGINIGEVVNLEHLARYSLGLSANGVVKSESDDACSPGYAQYSAKPPDNVTLPTISPGYGIITLWDRPTRELQNAHTAVPHLGDSRNTLRKAPVFPVSRLPGSGLRNNSTFLPSYQPQLSAPP